MIIYYVDSCHVEAFCLLKRKEKTAGMNTAGKGD